MTPLEQVKHTENNFIIGIDEVGYGCIAGPIYVCAFVAPKDWSLKGLKDSKALSAKTRELLCAELIDKSNKNVAYSIVHVHPNTFDTYKDYGYNVHAALKYLYWQSAYNIYKDFQERALIVLDGIIKFPEYPHILGQSISLPKADALVPHVSAASIIAKVHRDNYMTIQDKYHPQYNWSHNKGYPTPDHLAALHKYGYCNEHRLGYEPIKSMHNAKLEAAK